MLLFLYLVHVMPVFRMEYRHLIVWIHESLVWDPGLCFAKPGWKSKWLFI